MRCKIVRTQKLMYQNFVKSTKSKKKKKKKTLVLHYSIDWSITCAIHLKV